MSPQPRCSAAVHPAPAEQPPGHCRQQPGPVSALRLSDLVRAKQTGPRRIAYYPARADVR